MICPPPYLDEEVGVELVFLPLALLIDLLLDTMANGLSVLSRLSYT